MTAPTQQRLTAGQIAAIVALLQAQAAARQKLTAAAVAAAVTPFSVFTDWRDAKAVQRAITQVLRTLQPLQKQAARQTDVFAARVLSVMSGRSVRPVGAVDVKQLRRRMPQKLVEQLADELVTPAWVELGSMADGPSDRIDEPFQELVTVDDAEWLDPADVYGRVADGARYDQAAHGMDEPAARRRAIVRLQIAAHTDVTLAVRAQYMKALEAGRTVTAEGWRRVLRPELSESGPCGLCVVAADRVYSRGDLLPIHDRCVPAGTLVAAEGVRSLTRRRYSGVLVILRTAAGEELTITANHPVLTSQGWVPAHLVKEGDYVVRHRRGHGVVGRGPDENDAPPAVEDVWRATVMSGSLTRASVPVAAEDFHGDWSDSKVEAVSPNGLLSRVGDVSFDQPASERLLVDGHGLRVGLPSEGTPGEARFGEWSSASGGLSGCRHSGSLRLGHARVVEAQRLGDSPNLSVGLLEAETDYGALDSVLLGEGLFGGSGAVLLHDLLVGKPLPDATRFDPDGLQFSGEGRHAYAQLGLDLLKRLAGSVELDRVVDQRRVEGTHEVYNLHTVEGWYSANSLIVSNCVCEVLPIFDGMDPGLLLNSDDLARLYQEAGSTGGGKRQGGALKNVRVALTEHGELGPVLTRADQHFRGMQQVARTQSRDRRHQIEAQLETVEAFLDTLILRRRAGEDVDRPYDWYSSKFDKLRAELARVS